MRSTVLRSPTGGAITALRRLARRQWFVTNVAMLPPVAGKADTPGVTIRPATPHDGPALAPVVVGRETLAWRRARSDVALVAEVDGRVVGCTWLTASPLRPSYFPIMVWPRPGHWYNYGLRILPELRGQGIGRALSRAAIVEAGRLGGTLVYGHANTLDRAAAASHAAAGFVTTEALFGINVLGRYLLLMRRRELVHPNPLKG